MEYFLGDNFCNDELIVASQNTLCPSFLSLVTCNRNCNLSSHDACDISH